MSAHLAAVHGVDLAHALLDEGVPRLALHGLAAEAAHDLERAPGQPRVVHDPLAGRLREEGLREQADDVVALDELTELVEQEAAVVVAVPRDA